MPIETQINKSFKEIHDPKSLVQTLMSAFNATEDQFTSIWNQYHQQSLSGVDVALKALKDRQMMLDFHPYYKKSSFKVYQSLMLDNIIECRTVCKVES